MVLTTPSTFTFSVVSQSSMSLFRMLLLKMTPAFANTTPIFTPPKATSIWSRAPLKSVLLVTSQARAKTVRSGARARRSAAARSTVASCKSINATCMCKWSAAYFAKPQPIPKLPAPVMTATRPSRSASLNFSCCRLIAISFSVDRRGQFPKICYRGIAGR